MNKHKPECFKVLAHADGPCTCGIDDPPPVALHTVASIDPPCPHCRGTGKLTTPEPVDYKQVAPYRGGEPPRTSLEPVVESRPIMESHAT